MIRRRVSLGIGVGADTVRVLAIAGGCIQGTAVRSFNAPGELSIVLSEALSSLPQGAVPRRASVGVTLGASVAQVRKLGSDSDFDINEHPGRYFLSSGSTQLIAQPAAQTDGSVWAVAFDAQVVEAIADVCRSLRLRLLAIAPTIEALRLATNEPNVRWNDGDIGVQATFAADGELETIRRRVGLERCEVPRHMVPLLASLGAEAWEFADAFAAAILTSQPTRLALTGDALIGTQAGRRGRLGLPIAALAASLIGAAASPGLVAHRQAARATSELSTLERERATAMREYGKLTAATVAIAAVDTVASERRSMTMALAMLTRAVPDSVFLTNLRLDRQGGTLIVIGPRPASIVADLARARELDGPSLVGAVTPQLVGGTPLERATIRFKWAEALR